MRIRDLVSTRILVALSVGYGVLVALVAVFASSAVAAVATVGALVIGGLWVLQGVLSDRDRSG